MELTLLEDGKLAGNLLVKIAETDCPTSKSWNTGTSRKSEVSARRWPQQLIPQEHINSGRIVDVEGDLFSSAVVGGT